MSTNSAHEPFWAHWPFFGRKNHEHQPTGWQRTPERTTDGIPVLHQREQPVYQPQPERPFLAWRDQQPVLRPRLITETTPKLVDRGGHYQVVDPQVAQPLPPRAQNTEGMRRLCDQTPIPPTPTDWLHSPVPGQQPDALPIRRLNPTDNLLATMRPSRYQLEKIPVDELPTVKNEDGIVQSLLGSLPPWKPLPPPTTPPDEWLNSKPQSALSELERLSMRHNSETLEVPSVTKEIAKKHQRERE